MDFITVRELRAESGKVWDRVAAGEEIVITRNGKPFAILAPTQPSALEADLRALRGARLSAVLQRMQAQAQASGASALTDDEIQAEIDAVRREQTGAAQAMPEPAPRRHARRR